MKGRIYLLLFAVLIGLIAVFVKLFNIQVLDRKRFSEIGIKQSESRIRFERQRGTIYDRRGRELAVSLRVRSLAANPMKFIDASKRENTAKTLSNYLDIPFAAIEERLSRTGEFVWLKRKLTDDTADSIALLKIDGLFFRTEYKRTYLHDSSASHILGFVGIDDIGLEGIEKELDDELRGPDIEGEFITDAYGNPVPINGFFNYKRFNGNSVFLTIDHSIQAFLETALKMQVEAYNAKSASGIIIDPATGEILALSNLPDFNPNEPGDAPLENRRNRAITDVFEPGSTFKIFSGAIALGEALVKPEETFNCHGVLNVAGFPIRCHHTHGTIDYRKAIEVSCNVTAMLVAQRLNPNTMYAGLLDFGFGRKTGIELPGEVSGVLRPVREWSKLSLSVLALGQEISVTTLQLAVATAAMANGGKLIKPHIIRSIKDAEGRTVKSFPPEVIAQAIPAHISRLMGDIMQGVVKQGTGQLAGVKFFTVSGKTGTGQISGSTGGYIKGRYNAVFIGWVPAENPVLAMVIVIHDPDPSKGYYGGQVAAPVFGWAGTESLRYLGVRPENVSETIVTRIERERIRKFTGQVREGKVEVPDLSGLSIREVYEMLSTLPVSFKPSGSGIAASQEPAPGELVPVDSVIKVEFHTPGGMEQYIDIEN